MIRECPMTGLMTPSRVALLILAAACAVLGGAFYFQYGVGILPCKLCLQERYAYYAAVPLGLLAIFLPGRFARLLLAILALAFLGNALLGAYHAGVEWHFWAGPDDCSGGTAIPTNAGSLLSQLETAKVISCSEAGWRFAGISLAGWNTMISLILASMAASVAVKGGVCRRRAAA